MTYRLVKRDEKHKPDLGAVIAEHDDPKVLEAMWTPHNSTCLVWIADWKPIKRWPEASVKSARRKRLQSKLAKKCPLFADELYERELEQRPSHFTVEDEA